jgi:hypothetical protein
MHRNKRNQRSAPDRSASPTAQTITMPHLHLYMSHMQRTGGTLCQALRHTRRFTCGCASESRLYTEVMLWAKRQQGMFIIFAFEAFVSHAPCVHYKAEKQSKGKNPNSKAAKTKSNQNHSNGTTAPSGKCPVYNRKRKYPSSHYGYLSTQESKYPWAKQYVCSDSASGTTPVTCAVRVTKFTEANKFVRSFGLLPAVCTESQF